MKFLPDFQRSEILQRKMPPLPEALQTEFSGGFGYLPEFHEAKMSVRARKPSHWEGQAKRPAIRRSQ